MKILVSLNRLTTLYTAYSLMIGRHVILFPNELPRRPFSFLFGPLQKWIERHPRSTSALDNFPEIQKYLDIPGYYALVDVFSKTEQCMNEYFKFDQAKNNFKNYELFYKHITCGVSSRKYLTILFLHDIKNKLVDSDVVYINSDDFLLPLYESYFEEKLKIKTKTLKYPRFIVNFLIFLFVYLYSVMTVFRRINWRNSRQESAILGVDHIEDTRNIEIIDELIDIPSDCRIVYRSYSQFTTSKIDIGNFPVSHLSDGIIPVIDIFSSLCLISGDCLKILFRGHGLQEDHFFQIVTGPIRRIGFRALFNRFRFKYFWSRDDYNSEHILRTQELRRIGAVSMGISHGLPNPQLCDPHWRYLDYDIYYTFGEYLSKTRFGDMWPKNMDIKAVGSLGMTRKRLAALNDPRPNDIIFFAGPELGEELIVREVIEIAKAFPEKTIYVKNKRRHIKSKIFDSGLGNLVDTFENSYDLMFKAKYVVGGCSTVIAEAVQFDLCAYSFDYSGPNTDCIYRYFPGLCVYSAKQVIEKISAIESNKEKYPRENFAGLIHLSQDWGFDIVKQDMGLAQKVS